MRRKERERNKKKTLAVSKVRKEWKEGRGGDILVRSDWKREEEEEERERERERERWA